MDIKMPSDRFVCNKCSNTFRPPLMICKAFHIVCQHCKLHTNLFTGSEAALEDCANTAKELPHLNAFFSNKVDYCQYNCGFRGDIKKLWSHEISCRETKTLRGCLINNCKWEGFLEQLIQHVDSSHPGKIFVNSHFVSEEIIVEGKSGFYLILEFPKNYYCNELYWLRLHQNNDSLYFMILHLGTTGDTLVRAQKQTNFIITMGEEKNILLKGKILDFSEVTEERMKQNEFIELIGSKIQFLNEKYAINLVDKKCRALSESMLSALECMVCTEVMRPPIILCKIGHSICGLCISHLSYCPKCRSDLTKSRNFSMEAFVGRLTMPCIYERFGCLFNIPLEHHEYHELECQYQPIICVSYNCKQNIEFVNLIHHLQNIHKMEVRYGSETYVNKVPNKSQFTYEYLYEAFQHYFIFATDYISEDVVVSVYHVAKTKMCKFIMDIKIFNPDNGYSIGFTVPCQTLCVFVRDTITYIRIPRELFFDKICNNNEYSVILEMYRKL